MSKRIPVIFVVLLLAGSLASTDVGAHGVRPNILLITIDTLRADHLGCYGYKNGSTPSLDRFASEGILFRQAYTPVPLTLPAHASILTGLYPASHGIRDNAFFSSSNQLISEILQKNGYQTAAFVSGAPVSSGFGLDRGFDLYDDHFSGRERKADQTTERALRWIRASRTPYFVWIHYFDPHAEYEPPAVFRNRLKFPYDGEIAFVDQQIQQLLTQAGATTFVIITADHGESLGEHGEKTHGVFLYDATLRIPLMIKGPGIQPAIRNDGVTLLDIAPTILASAGVGSGVKMEGESLLATKKQRALFAESLYASRNFGYASLYAGILDGKKYISAPQPEFYDLTSDPGERKNIIRTAKPDPLRKETVRYSRKNLQRASEPLPEEEAEKLRSLGYVSGNEKETGIDPKTKIDAIENFNEGMRLLFLSEYKSAERLFQGITEKEPGNVLGFRFLGDAQSAQQEFPEAASSYSASWKLRPDPEVAVRLGKVLQRTNQASQAETLLRDATQKFPDYEQAVFELASIYGAQQKWVEAERLLQKDRPGYHNQLGILYLMRKLPDRAIVEFQSAIQGKPLSNYWNNLGIAQQQTGQTDEAEKAFRSGLLVDPDDEDCNTNLAFLMVEQKKWKEAVDPLEKVTRVNPRLYRARFALGFVYENLDRKPEARFIYSKLLSDAPANWLDRQKVESRIQAISGE